MKRGEESSQPTESQQLHKVTLISADTKEALVEYVQAGQARRVFVPVKLLEIDNSSGSAQVSTAALAAGKAYGVAWEKHLVIQASADSFAAALRNANIWTLADALQNPAAVQGALTAALGVDMGAFYTMVDKLRKEGAERGGKQNG